MTNPAIAPQTGSTPTAASTNPAGTPASGPSAPPHGLSAGAKAAIAIVAVAVIVLAVLAAGIVPGVSLFGKSSTSAAVGSSTAMSDANGVANSHDAGSLIYVIGVAPTYTFALPAEKGNSSCPLAGGVDENITIPAETSGYSSGNAVLWLFLYYNSATPSESLVVVASGTTYFLGTESGALCVGTFTGLPIAAGAISSTAAAAAADSDAGSFTSAHTQANAVFILAQNATAGPEWIVAYTNCSYNPATMKASGGTKGDLYEAEVNGTNSDVLLSVNEAGKANCTALSSITTTSKSYSLGMVSVSSTGAAGDWYEYLALAPTAGLTTAMFGMQVKTSGGTTLPLATVPTACAYGAESTACKAGTGWYAVLVSDTGLVLGTYGNASAEWGNLAPATDSVSLNSGMTLEIVSNVQYAGEGYTLSVYATGSSSVSGSVGL